jgi:hypothetical protein
VELVIMDESGATITTFDEPLVIRISASEAGEVPAFSPDGVTWTSIPRLTTPSLPTDQRDGYFRNADGSIDIFTRHATFFGMVKDVENPRTPHVHARITRTHLVLTWQNAKDNTAVIGYLIRRNGRDFRYLVGTTARVPLRTGDYVVRAVDSAGNHSARSRTVSVVKRHGEWDVSYRTNPRLGN